jgi:hypothetical protein
MRHDACDYWSVAALRRLSVSAEITIVKAHICDILRNLLTFIDFGVDFPLFIHFICSTKFQQRWAYATYDACDYWSVAALRRLSVSAEITIIIAHICDTLRHLLTFIDFNVAFPLFLHCICSTGFQKRWAYATWCMRLVISSGAA